MGFLDFWGDKWGWDTLLYIGSIFRWGWVAGNFGIIIITFDFRRSVRWAIDCGELNSKN